MRSHPAEVSVVYGGTRIIERANGYFWQPAEDDDMEFGPFPTLYDAVADFSEVDSEDESDGAAAGDE